MSLARRTLTPAYIIFYILFLPDTWRILIGIIAAVLVYPVAAEPDMVIAGRAMIFVMLAAIGYAVSGVPARWITGGLKKIIIGDKKQ